MEEKPTNDSDDFEFQVIRRKQRIMEKAEADTLEFKEVELDKLVAFDKHPFKLYEGQRFTDMVESVRANGVIVPIVVRSYIKEEGKYEILSGHNRVAAARKVGLKEVPVVIRKKLTDEEALLIVTETNLFQRSFVDLKHSERAVALSVHNEAMKKKPGYRTDLLTEIEELTCAPLGHGLRTRDKLGEQYSLGKTTIARYLRVNKLIPSLKERLDNDNIGMRVAEALSYLRIEEQDIVENLLAMGTKINTKQADTLKAESGKGEINLEKISKIMSSDYYPGKVKPVKLSGQFLERYSLQEKSPEEVEKIIAEALEQYLSNQSS